MVFIGAASSLFMADFPIKTSPLELSETTDGTTTEPSTGMTMTLPSFTKATSELVVPKSIPTIIIDSLI